MDSSADPANVLRPRKASEWLIALSERPHDRALRARLEDWLAATPENRHDWEEINVTWNTLGTLALQQPDASVPAAAPARLLRRRSLVAAVAAAAVALVLASGWASDMLVRLQADHATATAELRTLKLDDGSDISLGPLTAIDVAFSGTERRIRLRRGEAFFVVASGDHRPFVVEAGPIEARDIGTAFDVRTNPEMTEVSVQNGLVDVSTPNSGEPPERLQAGDSVKIAARTGRHRQKLDPGQIATWRQRQLVVDNQSVDVVVDAIRPYYSGAILVQGGRFPREPLTGVYNLADPATALRAVAAAHGASFHRLSPWLIVLNGD